MPISLRHLTVQCSTNASLPIQMTMARAYGEAQEDDRVALLAMHPCAVKQLRFEFGFVGNVRP